MPLHTHKTRLSLPRSMRMARADPLVRSTELRDSQVSSSQATSCGRRTDDVVALKWFGPDGGEPEEYQGGREVLDLAAL